MAFEDFDEYEELSVVSDLHLGGARDSAIFMEGEAFQAFCRQQAKSKRRLGFVVNGDFVDFLPDRPAKTYFDGSDAVGQLDEIAKDERFAPVFRGLQELLTKKADAQLIITIGNHDLELAVPRVREKLLDLIDPSGATRRRIRLSLDGSGYRCRVGTASVVCIHGNDVDNWNVNDYEALRRHLRGENFGKGADEWTPNAGTKLVVDVMNGLKRRYPFVNLLQPTVGAVLPLLAALEPPLVPLLDDGLRIATKLGVDAIRRWAGFLGDGDRQPIDTPVVTGPVSALRSPFSAMRGADHREEQERFMAELEQRFERNDDPHLLDAGPEAQLGRFTPLRPFFHRDKKKAARKALEELATDRSLELNAIDSQARHLDKLAGGGARIVVAGHTHLPRSHSRQAGWYLNSGSWTVTGGLKPIDWVDDARFDIVWKAIEQQDSQALWDAGLLRRNRGVATVRKEPKRIVAGLLMIAEDGAEGGFVKDSQWVVE
ncbi:MAG: metallophosphoesterase [Bryobacteraceae bacterium]